MTRQRCIAPGCGRFIRNGETWCKRHHPAAPWAETDDEFGNGRTEHADALAAEFRRRLERGDYRALLGPDVNAVIEQAAREHEVTDEIGILRIVLAKLLQTEEDPAKLAAGVAKVAGVAVQASRLRRLMAGGPGDTISDAINRILDEVGDGVSAT